MPIDKNYVTVRERLIAAQEQIASVVVQNIQMVGNDRGIITVRVTLKDERFAEGSEAFEFGLPGKSARATSPVPDAETSALGRALQWLGFYADRPSLEEMQRAQAAQEESDAVEALRIQLIDLAGIVESSGHQITAAEDKVLREAGTLPAWRLQNGIEHFTKVLKGLPKRTGA